MYYSNRSAAHAALQQWREALEDAQACTRLKPRWGKGWSRRGAAQSGLELHGEVSSREQAFHLLQQVHLTWRHIGLHAHTCKGLLAEAGNLCKLAQGRLQGMLAWRGSQGWMSLQQHDARQALKLRASPLNCLYCFSDRVITAYMLDGLSALCSIFNF